jgi:hypothetical protein
VKPAKLAVRVGVGVAVGDAENGSAVERAADGLDTLRRDRAGL